MVTGLGPKLLGALQMALDVIGLWGRGMTRSDAALSPVMSRMSAMAKAVRTEPSGEFGH
jgi:hypothetical protein